jgi:hypothetical protein
MKYENMFEEKIAYINIEQDVNEKINNTLKKIQNAKIIAILRAKKL